MRFLLLLLVFSCTPQKPNALRKAPPMTEFDKKDGRVKARDKFNNKERVEYYNEIQHK